MLAKQQFPIKKYLRYHQVFLGWRMGFPRGMRSKEGGLKTPSNLENETLPSFCIL